jgi:hypothetical protein
LESTASERMMDGVQPRIRDHQAAIDELCVRHHVARLELFGSAAGGDFEPGRSDFDFLVQFGEVPDGAYADAYFGLLEGLEELLESHVDLVVVDAVRNPYFLESIERTRTTLYAA